MQVDLKNRTAIVCGCTQGIGKAIAEKFAENGCGLVLISRNEQDLLSVCREIKAEYGVSIRNIVADFENPCDLQVKLEVLAEDDVDVDILVNNVGGPEPAEVMEITPTQFHRTLDRHLISSHTLVKVVLPLMRKKSFGRIINIIGTVYHTPYPGLALSSIRAVETSWAKALSIEVAEHGVTVNNIAPGPTDTNELTELIEVLSRKEGITPAALRKKIEESVPLGRVAKPMEVASAALYLASMEASYVTGTTLVIDGGFTPSIR